MKEEQSSIDEVKKLIERGKQKGTLSYEEIMDTLQSFDLSSEKIDSIYEHFGAIGIKISSDGSGKRMLKMVKPKKKMMKPMWICLFLTVLLSMIPSVCT